MRAALSTIQQTLTDEAAALLSQAIGEAARRRHGQTTPLHVAASLLSCPSGILREACVRSHPHSSHRLQCRALDLCFSVALDRLPSSLPSNTESSSSSVTEPPISNALLAALKRAQAHQRRGCPEQQQQPLLAVKVELDQLVLSILDDPSVSRVMREASFSSPSVKASIEQSLSSPSNTSISQIAFFLPSHSSSTNGTNPYSNPQFHDRPDEVKRVLEIMARGQRRNPVLVGDSDPRPILKDVLRRIESGADPLVPASLRGAQVFSLEKDFAEQSRILARIRELGASIESRAEEVSVVLDLGDLKYMVEGAGSAQHHQPIVASETVRSAVVEMTNLLNRFNNGSSQRIWLVGLATCATYLRCQVYHPVVEDNWDLQAAPIAPRSPLPHLFPRVGANGILATSKETLSPVRSFPPRRSAPSLDRSDSSQKSSLCSLCMEDYERELAKLVAMEFERSSSATKEKSGNPLPSWLRIAKEQDHSQPKKQEIKWKQRSVELLKRWQESCSELHHPHSSAVPIDSRKPTALSVSPSLPPTPKLSLQISYLKRAASPPDSPVKTDLILGQSKPSSTTVVKLHKDRVKESDCCQQDKPDPCISEVDSFKRLFYGLTERVGWQTEAASAIATAVVQCKSGHRKLKSICSKGAIWLLFDGSDRVGKLKMAAALSELIFVTTPITVRLGASPIDNNYSNSDTVLRGKTSMDRVADALSRNPFSVIVIEGINSANTIDKNTLKSAMKRGRLLDSHGREISLQNTIFILLTDDPSPVHYEEKILESARTEWLLEFAILESVGKRQPDWLGKDERSIKRSRKSPPPSLSLDLNLAIGTEDDENEDPAEGSGNSSDLTVEHEQEKENKRLGIKKLAETKASLPSWAATELPLLVDEMVLFQPIDFTSVKRKVTDFIRSKFKEIICHEHSIRIEEDALDKIISFVRCNGLEGWAEMMLVPGIHQLKTRLKATAEPVTVQLIAKKVNHVVSRELLPAVVSAGSIKVSGL
ncbi:protein SMAX1-LIKE 2 [Dendrobium catenatum]|uniref:Chaperone protein ClpB1 n=1 Tax=Dendrobium catenatum TaxID=906689 RepID=A0A2I0WL66_9ASPA|nr:protein SMAX1-LIKE 2 [Dendrobium catenatum]PKU76396.1 Chaperone protein ClpB1 [Dendrobium catenatum]